MGVDNDKDSSGNSEEFYVKYNNEVYNVKEFMHKHPGGIETLNKWKSMDITNRLGAAPPHSDAALYLLKEYKVVNHNNKNIIANNGGGGGDSVTSNGGGVFDKNVDKNSCDDSMEHLVDWSKAMIPQVGKLGTLYSEWVNKPVDRPLRLFGPWYLECLTKTPWWIVPMVWIPAITFIVKHEYLTNELLAEHNPFSSIIFNLAMGVALWSLLEYCLHRWLFHIDTSKFGWKVHTMHFLLHGLHHKVPFDSHRLVFPPVPAFILASLFYQPLFIVFDFPRLIVAGGLIGYVAYDMTHFYLHYGSPSGGHLYHMKRYHYQHHFVHHDQGFGISTPIWDYVFSTRIFLRKLSYILKWK